MEKLYTFDPARRETYQRHAASCAPCADVDARVAGARRCNVGFRSLLDAIVNPPTALAGPLVGQCVESTEG